MAQAGVKSLAGFVLRWNPAVETIKSLVAGGAIGQLFYAEIDYWHRMKPAHHAWHLHSRKQTGGSAMLLGGCHAVDALRWLTGDEVVEVSAMSNNQRGLFEYAANVVAVMRFRSGIIGKTSALLDCEMPYAFNIDVAGTEGTDPRQPPVVEAAAAGADGLDDHPHDPARLGRRPPPSVRRRDQPLGRLHPPGPRIALQRGRRLPQPRVVPGHRPLAGRRRAAGDVAAGLTHAPHAASAAKSWNVAN